MKISENKKAKINEQILSFLFSISPKATFTSHIAKEIARDEEFIKNLLEDLKNKKIVSEIKKNPHGVNYTRRSRWKLSDEVYLIYKNKQE